MSRRSAPPEGAQRSARSIALVTAAWLAMFVASAWPDLRVAGALVVLCGVRVAFNVVASARLRDRMHTAGGMLAFAIVNTAISVASAHLVRWHLVALMELPFQILMTNPTGPGRRVHAWVAAVLLVNGGVARLDGVPVATLGVVLVASAFIHFVAEERNVLLRETLRALDRSHAATLGVHRDLEAMHAKLQRQDRLTSLGMIAAGIAHEINNPMSYVTSNVDALAEDLAAQPLSPALLREYLEDILPATQDGIRRVNAIVADLRRFARGEKEAPAAFDLNHEVDVALRMAAGHLRGRAVVTQELDVGLGEIVGRPQQIGQVVLNLVVNAVQATGNGGHIQVSTRAAGDHVLLRVCDDGPGMDEETQRRAFEPFFTTKPPGQGTGLGLSAVHGIVTQHGGTVTVESAPGRGATFTIRLPRKASLASAQRQSLPHVLVGSESTAEPR